MCEPVSLTMGGLALAGAATSIVGQTQAKKGQEDYQERMRLATEDQIIANRKRATDDYINQVRVEQARQQQEQESMIEKAGDITRQSQSVQSTAKASAAERGISVDSHAITQILSDYHAQEALEIGRLRESQKFGEQQHQDMVGGFGRQFAERASAIQRHQPKPIQQVDYFGPIFGAAKQGIEGGLETKAFKDMFSVPTPASGT